MSEIVLPNDVRELTQESYQNAVKKLLAVEELSRELHRVKSEECALKTKVGCLERAFERLESFSSDLQRQLEAKHGPEVISFILAQREEVGDGEIVEKLCQENHKLKALLTLRGDDVKEDLKERLEESGQMNEELRLQLKKKSEQSVALQELERAVELKNSLVSGLSEKLEQCDASLNAEREERMKMDIQYNKMRNSMQKTIEHLQNQMQQHTREVHTMWESPCSEIEIQTDITNVELEEFRREIDSFCFQKKDEEVPHIITLEVKEEEEKQEEEEELFKLRGELSVEREERQTYEIQAMQLSEMNSTLRKELKVSHEKQATVEAGLKQELHDVKKKANELFLENSAVKKEVDQMRLVLRDREQEVSVMQRRLREADGGEKLAAKTREVINLRGENEAFQQQVDAYARNVNELHRESARSKDQLVQMTSERTFLQQQIRDLKQKLDRAIASHREMEQEKALQEKTMMSINILLDERTSDVSRQQRIIDELRRQLKSHRQQQTQDTSGSSPAQVQPTIYDSGSSTMSSGYSSFAPGSHSVLSRGEYGPLHDWMRREGVRSSVAPAKVRASSAESDAFPSVVRRPASLVSSPPESTPRLPPKQVLECPRCEAQFSTSDFSAYRQHLEQCLS
eukprot:m.11965 g.11965  ORF g.11965 m.11965 type:complete len:629 (+) comp23702_c0_seq1:100-1986(+)